MATKHKWSKTDIRLVFETCKSNGNKQSRLEILKTLFPDCSNGSLHFQIIRYQKRNDNTLRWIPQQNILEGYGSNGRLHDEVWSECDWRMN